MLPRREGARYPGSGRRMLPRMVSTPNPRERVIPRKATASAPDLAGVMLSLRGAEDS